MSQSGRYIRTARSGPDTSPRPCECIRLHSPKEHARESDISLSDAHSSALHHKSRHLTAPGTTDRGNPEDTGTAPPLQPAPGPCNSARRHPSEPLRCWTSASPCDKTPGSRCHLGRLAPSSGVLWWQACHLDAASVPTVQKTFWRFRIHHVCKTSLWKQHKQALTSLNIISKCLDSREPWPLLHGCRATNVMSLPCKYEEL